MSMPKSKAAAAAKKKVTHKNPMAEVISFRMTKPQYAALQAIFKKESCVGVRSERQFARKLVCDFVAGKLKYTNEKDRRLDSSFV